MGHFFPVLKNNGKCMKCNNVLKSLFLSFWQSRSLAYISTFSQGSSLAKAYLQGVNLTRHTGLFYASRLSKFVKLSESMCIWSPSFCVCLKWLAKSSLFRELRVEPQSSSTDIASALPGLGGRCSNRTTRQSVLPFSPSASVLLCSTSPSFAHDTITSLLLTAPSPPSPNVGPLLRCGRTL